MNLAYRPHFLRKWEYFPEYALAQVPRYTSYPPANRFTTDVGAEAALTALQRLPHQSSLSLYLHIPFCKRLCWYCGCHTSVPTLADPVDSYVEALVQEIEHVGRAAPPRAEVTHIHFGGGSPDTLQPGQVNRLFHALHDAFRVSRSTEMAAEFDPRGVTADVVAAFVDGGLTRASLGVQVLDREVQQRVNRVQSIEEIEDAIDVLRAKGISNLNIDMMYGLPGQTREHVIETALFAAGLNADRVATFGYAHVPWMKKHQKGITSKDLPDGEQRFRQAEAAAETLELAGYLPIGFDHFAAPGDTLAIAEREGRLRRNFQGYTDDAAAALIGFGASAISSLPDLIYQNTTDTAAYRDAVGQSRIPASRGRVRSVDDLRVGRLIERILCDFEADAPGDLFIAASASLASMALAGLVQISGTRVSVTEKGRPYVRNVAACFDRDLNCAAARHSLAV